MTVPADAAARHRIEADFGSTLFVEAAAGTGKTATLVRRVIGLVRSGTTTLERIVALTFTEMAAGEMKLRLRTEIEKARELAEASERARLDQALEELELARIGTIHSFCGDLLRERPVEARIDPLFAVASEDEATALADQAFDAWFQRILSDPPEGVRRLLRRRSKGNPPRKQLRNASSTLREHRDFPCRWRRDPFDRDRTIDAIVDRLDELGALAAESTWPDDYLARNLSDIARFVEEATRLEKVSGRDYDGLEAELRPLSRDRSWTWKGSARTRFGNRSRDDVLALRDRVKADLDAFREASDADLAPLLHEALLPVVAAYEALKTKAGRLDFLDLLIKARDLLRDDAMVRADFQSRFSHYFVDEVQDTDPLQVEILLLLASADRDEHDWRRVRPVPGKLFLVGDPKQSLYRFRRADIAIYRDLRDRLLEGGAALLHLTTSFRAPPSIQGVVNGAFAPAMAVGAPGTQAEYVPLTPARPECAGQPTIVALPVPRPYGEWGTVTNRAVEESFPDAVAAFVAWLVEESGWTVEEKGVRVPIRPRHVAVLFRRFQNFGGDVSRAYVRGLEARRVPHVLVGGRSFHDREEVIALRNALVAIEWPDDELRVFATLRGPFVALADAAILAYRQYVDPDGSLRTRRLDPTRSVDPAALPPEAVPVVDSLALLRTLHRGRNHRPIAQTVGMFLEGVRAHAGLALWPTGEQALANCQRLIDMARSFEAKASSFRAFVERLESDAEEGRTGEALIVEEGTEGVRLMTVHKAKGLEFPVVILADPTCKAARDTPSRHVDPSRQLWLEALCGSAPIELIEAAGEELERDRAEAVRVAYVAATRAQDLLVVPVCGDGPIAGWLEALDPMLYPAPGARAAARPASGCPKFDEFSILDRGAKGKPPLEGCVRPGLHRPQADGPDVVWWSPSALRLDVPAQGPLQQQQILQVDPGGVVAAASEAAYAEWRGGRDAAVERASRASISAEPVTALSRSAVSQSPGTASVHQTHDTNSAPGRPDVSIEFVERTVSKRPTGRRFGTLVHAVLASIDLDANAGVIGSSAELNGRIVGATSDEISAAAQTIETALQHPIFARAMKANEKGALRRETPVVLRRHDGSLAEGVIDLAFREQGADAELWTVVDFKTDREFATGARYVEQVRLYVEAVSTSTGLASTGTILVI